MNVFTKNCFSKVKCFTCLNFQAGKFVKSHNLLSVYCQASIRAISITTDLHQEQEWNKNTAIENSYIAKIPVALKHYSGVSKKEIETYLSIRPLITNDLVTDESVKELEFANQRLLGMMNHVMPSEFSGGGVLLLAADRFYADQRRANNTMLINEDEHFRLACILCWTYEMVIRGTGVHDDFVDKGTTRQNAVCWHKVTGVGEHAVIDGRILFEGYIILLKKYFGLKDYYAELLEHFAQGIYEMTLGMSQMDNIRPDTDGNM